MSDNLTRAQRTHAMRSVRNRDTKPEILVRSLLHRNGFRFRLHRKKLAGAPDIVLTRHRLIIFVNGCFWHSHRGCSRATIPTTNRVFWQKKLRDNRLRDRRNIRANRELGWRVLTVWSCQLRNSTGFEKRFLERVNQLRVGGGKPMAIRRAARMNGRGAIS